MRSGIKKDASGLQRRKPRMKRSGRDRRREEERSKKSIRFRTTNPLHPDNQKSFSKDTEGGREGERDVRDVLEDLRRRKSHDDPPLFWHR